MIAITIDIDWAPDPMVDDIMQLLDEKRVPATIYCTNHTTDISGQSSCLQDRYSARYELGLHPNFLKVSNNVDVIKNLKKYYPNAVGYRSHQGCSGAPILFSAIKNSLIYEVSCLIPQLHVPHFKFNEMYSDFTVFMTYFFDSQKLHDLNFQWQLSSFKEKGDFEDQDKLFIFGFHPVILYYDMQHIDEYYLRKPTYHAVNEKDAFKFKKNKGAMKLLKELILEYAPETFTTVEQYLKKENLRSGFSKKDAATLLPNFNF